MSQSPTARAPEVAALMSCLDDQRRHVLGILDGLGEAALRRPVLPTGWNCLGMVAHLAAHVERFWFVAVFAGDPTAIAETTASTDDTWHVPADTPAAEVLDHYRHQTEVANRVCADADPVAGMAWWPEGLFGDWRIDTLREVMLHVIVETACHAGHLDAARELIDGRTWLVLP
jgi:Protein of unknown function (DUF664)